MKKMFENRNNKILLALFLSTMAVYVAVFAAAFAELPISIGPEHQLLFLYFHFVPMFFLELLLCKMTRLLWQVLVPILLLAVPVVIFAAMCGFHVMAWILGEIWCVAPVTGSLLGWMIWHIHHWLKRKTQ